MSLRSTRNWGTPAEGFEGHVATDGSLLGSAGKWGACGCSVVQLDYDEELEPLHGMYCSMEAELEVQQTMKRAELAAFLCLLKKVQSACRQQRNYQRAVERRKENALIRKLAMLTCGSKLGKSSIFECQKKYWWKWSMSKRTAQRRKRKKFVAEGNEKADELEKAGAMLDEGFMAETSAKTVQQQRERSVCSPAVCGQFSLSGGGMERL